MSSRGPKADPYVLLYIEDKPFPYRYGSGGGSGGGGDSGNGSGNGNSNGRRIVGRVQRSETKWGDLVMVG
jgi:hypothetical protein